MKQEYLEAIKLRAKIGGMLTPADQILLIKDLIHRVDTIEEKLNEKTTTARSGNSKVSKRKTTTS